jgi:hypothetical protein
MELCVEWAIGNREQATGSVSDCLVPVAIFLGLDLLWREPESDPSATLKNVWPQDDGWNCVCGEIDNC